VKKVLVYVEGPSDKAALNVLLNPLIEEKSRNGTAIYFFETPAGDRKESLLSKVPLKAANILVNDPSAVVVVLPDLFPYNKCFRHENVNELMQGVQDRFLHALVSRAGENSSIYQDRFKVFCFKHDMEVLLLASTDALKKYLGATRLPDWKTPFEEINNAKPPKTIITDLFIKHGKRYKDTVDAPLVLQSVSYQELTEKCFQCFKPFIDFLHTL